MKNNMNVSETVLGWFYLLFHLCLLPYVMRWVNSQLPEPLSEAWLSLLSYGFSALFLMMICHSFLATAGSNMTKNASGWLRAVALGFCIYFTSDAMMDLFMSNFHPEFARVTDSTLVTLTKLEFLPMALGVIFLVPFVEEMLFRGLIFRTLFTQSKSLGYVVATIIYAFMHITGYMDDYEPFSLFLCFLQFVPAGFTLAWTYANSDNILAPITIHVIINTMGVAAMR
jgi:membrane protease YdiL (CAAX protease family)